MDNDGEMNGVSLDFIPGPSAREMENSTPIVNNPVFIANNTDMNYEVNTESGTAPIGNINEPVVDLMVENLAALQGLIGNLVTNSQEIIPKLGGSKTINIKCNLIDVESTNGTGRGCYLQILIV